MCSCQAALFHRSLKRQEFGLALVLTWTKPQLDSGILHNIPAKSHMNKHTHMPAHTHKQMVDGENRIVQQGKDILPQLLIVYLSFQSTLESTRLPLTWHVFTNYIITTVSTHMPSFLDASSHRKLGFSHCMVNLASWPNGHWLPTRSYPLLPSVLIHPFAN